MGNLADKIYFVKNQLTLDEIDDIMCNCLGSDGYVVDSQGNHCYTTVCHGGKSHKLYYYNSTKIFHCYTECGHIGDIFALVKKINNYDSYWEAYEFVSKYFGLYNLGGYEVPKEEKEIVEDWNILNKFKDYAEFYAEDAESSAYTTYSDDILRFYSNKFPVEWLSDGISAEAMAKYGIRYDIAGRKAIIPHYDINGELVGIRGRTFDPKEIAERGKYAPVYYNGKMYNHKLNLHLYGLDKVKQNIERIGKVCLAESEKACMQSQTMFGDNNFTVATCGSSGLSKKQIELLIDCHAKEVILAYDQECENLNDEDEVKKYESKLLKIAQPLTPFFDVYVIFDYDGLLGYKDSPFDKGKDILLKLMKQKVVIPSITSSPTEGRRKKY